MRKILNTSPPFNLRTAFLPAILAVGFFASGVPAEESKISPANKDPDPNSLLIPENQVSAKFDEFVLRQFSNFLNNPSPEACAELLSNLYGIPTKCNSENNFQVNMITAETVAGRLQFFNATHVLNRKDTDLIITGLKHTAKEYCELSSSNEIEQLASLCGDLHVQAHIVLNMAKNTKLEIGDLPTDPKQYTKAFKLIKQHLDVCIESGLVSAEDETYKLSDTVVKLSKSKNSPTIRLIGSEGEFRALITSANNEKLEVPLAYLEFRLRTACTFATTVGKILRKLNAGEELELYEQPIGPEALAPEGDREPPILKPHILEMTAQQFAGLFGKPRAAGTR